MRFFVEPAARRARTVATAVSWVAFILAGSAGSAHAELIYGISATSLLSFDSATPQTMTTIGPITGLLGGQILRAIDFRPSNGLLYAMSSGGTGTAAQLYTVNLANGALTAVGSGLALTTNGNNNLSIDFDPRADVLRVVSGNGRNFRINANTGALIAQDTTIIVDAVLGDIAYSNNVVGATSTTLYTYDFSDDFIKTIGSVGGTPNSPNGGQLSSVGDSGQVAGFASIGFDISGATGVAYLTLDENSSPENNTELYRVNLTNGAATLIGTNTVALIDISVSRATGAAVPEPGTLALVSMGLVTGARLVSRRRKSKAL